jgi:hypothetical protein
MTRQIIFLLNFLLLFYFTHMLITCMIVFKPCISRDSVVGIATGYWLDDGGVGVWVPVWSKIFSSPRCPDRLWGPPNLLFNGYRGLSPRGESGRVVKLTTLPQLVPKPRKYGLYSHSPIRLHGVVLSTRTTLPFKPCSKYIFYHKVSYCYNIIRHPSSYWRGESQPTFRRNMSPPSSRSKNNPSKKSAWSG